MYLHLQGSSLWLKALIILSILSQCEIHSEDKEESWASAVSHDRLRAREEKGLTRVTHISGRTDSPDVHLYIYRYCFLVFLG